MYSNGKNINELSEVYQDNRFHSEGPIQNIPQVTKPGGVLRFKKKEVFFNSGVEKTAEKAPVLVLFQGIIYSIRDMYILIIKR